MRYHHRPLSFCIPYSKDLNEIFQISGESYLNFKLNIDKYILYLNKKEVSILDEILRLFVRNINQDDVCSYDPDDPDYKVFSLEDRDQIIKLKDKLLLYFKRELGTATIADNCQMLFKQSDRNKNKK